MVDLLPEEDKDIAFNYIIMNLLILALDRDIEAIRNSKLKLKEQHVLLMERVRDLAIKDSSKIKKETFRRGIKVFDKEIVNEDFVRYPYTIRGYESEFRCLVYALKTHTLKKLNYYYNLVVPNQDRT
ncbi:hypothetical protein D1B31_18090 [Neobacillus notoginsengisoli]|uniref:Uncharacterized protein n=1 Tax=Neobacillus notoginsengisoli TaxID=1578198 RepID=A0A417YQ47_9BACI|nr:hypothetical protein [Neobacillus notoginsengisoli]RHW35999.1 hypothetical protein D1B31_18090 [Neobacillus notoginsengisoli]